MLVLFHFSNTKHLCFFRKGLRIRPHILQTEPFLKGQMELTTAVNQAFSLLLATPPCSLGDTLEMFVGGFLFGWFLGGLCAWGEGGVVCVGGVWFCFFK